MPLDHARVRPWSSAAGPIFDAHFHVIDHRFPLQANAGFLPEPFPAEAYRAAAEPLGVVGGAAVAGSFQAFDLDWLLDALAALGPAFVGVAQLPPSVSDDEIAALDAAGVRAVRFNLYRGGSAGEADLDRLARRVWDVAGWHAELYVDAATVDVGRLAAPAEGGDRPPRHDRRRPETVAAPGGGRRVGQGDRVRPGRARRGRRR